MGAGRGVVRGGRRRLLVRGIREGVLEELLGHRSPEGIGTKRGKEMGEMGNIEIEFGIGIGMVERMEIPATEIEKGTGTRIDIVTAITGTGEKGTDIDQLKLFMSYAWSICLVENMYSFC